MRGGIELKGNLGKMQSVSAAAGGHGVGHTEIACRLACACEWAYALPLSLQPNKCQGFLSSLVNDYIKAAEKRRTGEGSDANEKQTG